MLRLSELKLPLDHHEDAVGEAVCRRLRIPRMALREIHLVRRSVDARRKGAIALVYCLDLELDLPAAELRRLLRRFDGDPHLRPTPDCRYRPVAGPGSDHPLTVDSAWRPVVVGAGPCGYFAALLLAQMGLRPLLLERGRPVKQRSADTFGFWRGQRPFDPESNAQFGEGGAGTFSDGKLYSQVSEDGRLVRKVLEELVASGANREILTLHRPHIGTFKLATVVRGLRRRIEELGGEVRFEARLQELLLDPEPDSASHHRLRGVRLANGEEITASRVILAPGHSARDTFAALHAQGVAIERKALAIGVRIEHPQSLIDRAQWGDAAGHPRLGAAEYKLVHHCGNGRAVYSFCMCPGGLVVAATSEPGCVVTNGMSQHSRNERNANSGLVVSIAHEDMEAWGRWPGDPLAGIAFQKHWERRAFEAGGADYRAPGQWVRDFLEHRPSSASGDERPEQGLQASYLPGIRLGSLDTCLPESVCEALREALPAFERRIPGYAGGDSLLTGVETRTSSPVRLLRDQATLESVNVQGLFPGGEGAGYAGGILSAAIDGIRLAEAVALSLPRPPHREEPGGSACGRA
ncbi:MAG: NAD(P)/FAD-dependent oxidoreductase [Cyanobium sp.]